MASISELRDGLAANLRTISGLRVSAEIPEGVNPPNAIVVFDRVQYHQSYKNGMASYAFTIQVIVSRVEERNAQRYLDAYCSTTGSSSVLLAVESDKTLGGKAFDTYVSEMSSYGSINIQDNTYLAAEFQVQVLAS
jgi:hypothetical protein